MINKHRFFTSTFSFVIVGIQPSIGWTSFEITHIKKEWREILSPTQYAILREWKTERPFSSSLYGEKSNLLNKNLTEEYCCAGCGPALYSSENKYDSSTGWPSFWKPILGNVDCSDDRHFFKILVGVHCRHCGGHLGNVFDDGPEPTGNRHCINALALIFKET